MFVHPYSCVDTSFILKRLCVHPLVAIRADVSRCIDLPPDLSCLQNLDPKINQDIATALNEALQVIKEVTGKSACLQFESEKVAYPITHTVNRYKGYPTPRKSPPMKQQTGEWKSVELCDNHFIIAGTRKAMLIGQAAVFYTDEDGDGFREKATAILFSGEPLGIDPCQAQAFFEGESGNEEYRIRPRLGYEIPEGGNDLVLTYNTWDLVKPSALTVPLSYAAFGRNDPPSVDLCCAFNVDGSVADPDNCPLAAVVDVYLISVNQENCPATLYYSGGTDKCSCGKNGCITEGMPACTQDTGICNSVRLVPSKEVIDEETGETSCHADVCTCRSEPDYAIVNYLGGGEVDIYDGCLELDTYQYQDALYWLTLARLKSEGCDCKEWTDISEAQTVPTTPSLTGQLRAENHPDRDDPDYGTVVTMGTIGERRAWGMIKQIRDKGLCK